MTDFIETKASISATEAGAITGTAWIFAEPDRVGDVIVKGAISASLPLPMLAYHDQAQPVGVWEEVIESDEGLVCKGRLLVGELERARELHALIRAGAVRGLSIGFATKNAKRTAKGRQINALDLLEISLVPVPAHPLATITGLKANPTTIANGETPQMEDQLNQAPEAAPVANAPQIDLKAFDAMRARLDAIEAKAARPGASVAVAMPIEQKAFGSFLRIGDRMDEIERKALTVSANANGGFLVPAEFGNELIKLLTEHSPIRQYARVMQVEGSAITMPRRVSGTSAVWTEEGADVTESNMVFEQVTVANHELSTFVDVSNKLLEDNAYNLEGELLADFAENFGKAEGLAFVKGTGTGQPRGIMTAAGIREIRTGVAAAFPPANPADVLIRMFHEIPTAHAHKACWLMNRSTLATVRTWKTADGRYLVIDPQDGAPSTLLGRPVVEMPDMDSIAAGTFPILFGDLAGYRIVDRVGLSVLRDPYSLGNKSQVRFIARKRVGADLTNPDRFVKLRVAA